LNGVGGSARWLPILGWARTPGIGAAMAHIVRSSAVFASLFMSSSVFLRRPELKPSGAAAGWDHFMKLLSCAQQKSRAGRPARLSVGR
jgi:hypothetical protein